MSAVGRRYARALLDLADDSGRTREIGRELASLGSTWSASKELRDVFENPAVGMSARKEVIKSVSTRLGMSQVVVNTLNLMADRGRLRHVPEVVHAFQSLAEESTGQVRAFVSTATPMPESYFTQLRGALEELTGKKVVIEKNVDPTLIGGVVTRVGDRVFDGSIKNRLKELEDELLGLN